MITTAMLKRYSEGRVAATYVVKVLALPKNGGCDMCIDFLAGLIMFPKSTIQTF